MAIIETKSIDGKRVPTKITIKGDQLDSGVGVIAYNHALRLADGTYADEGGDSFKLQDELSFTDSNGTTGLAVMQYLAEWFEYKRGA